LLQEGLLSLAEEFTRMSRIAKVDCPHCGASLTKDRGIRVGKSVKCPKCSTVFQARDDCSSAAVPVGLALEPTRSANALRLMAVLLALLGYLGGGAVLALYCFTLNNATKQAALHAESTSSPNGESGDDGPPAPLPPPRPALTGNPEEQRKINDAIVKGVWFLKDAQFPDGTWQASTPVGYSALAGLTLLECDVPPDDVVVQKAAAYVRREVLKLGTTYDNYQRALTILFLDRLGDKQDEGLIQYLALCLIAGQHPSQGAWSYSAPALDRPRVPQLLKQLANSKSSLDNWRKTALNGKSFDINGWDNSNTQFAILALWAAQRHQVPIRRSITLVEQHFRKTQLPNGPDPKGDNLNLDGSWYYNAVENSGAWPSMTCAGLLGLAMAHGLTEVLQQKPLDDPAVRRGLAMLAREIDRPAEKRGPDYYFLWSLERVGVLYNLKTIEGKDWYAWGCKVLLPRQQVGGNWVDGHYYGNNTILDTCFVLLFLKQANLAKDLTSKLELLAERK
jgi:hypothetical protein